jgi:hypothetical protein
MSTPPNCAEVSSPSTDNDRLTSEDLAALLIDALLRAKIVKQEDVEQAMTIAIEEIDARKAIGDY